ncbi:hypothetical protein BDK51DRAFT_38813 [Blyttiomyces helicus]|uniref:Uncharacterized protein n=1 Tax=Blyttiomyces helicus TaxID=388810 RepID=A0A4P9W2A2_9FUNG|nr:hypothetical protein BDK51DRAFT_38813 [Blyttiomyces helicus]|eukprot:RKO86274.1 hypothetical protein BDK51DRAFT_38813 [Blyttiomyces helicus]
MPRQMLITCLGCEDTTGPLYQSGAHLADSSVRVPAEPASSLPDSPFGDMPSPSSSVNRSPGKRRDRAGASTAPIQCNACFKNIVLGEMRVFVDEEARGRRDRWVEPEFEVEAVCTPCWKKYKFCSACGGGGRFRTGKWRPKELFLPGRKTCRLSHERLGVYSFDFELRRCPEELTPDDLSTIDSFWVDDFLRTTAQAREMETLDGLDTFDRVMARMHESAAEIGRFLRENPSPGRRRYVVLMWASSTARRRKNTAAGDADRLSPPPSPRPRRLRGFLSLEIDHPAGVMYAGYGAFTPFSRPIFCAVFDLIVGGIQPDLDAAGGPPLHSFWLPARKRLADLPFSSASSATQLLSWRGTGLVPMTQFCALTGVKPDAFVSPMLFPPGVEAFFEPHVASFETLLQWARSNQRRHR